MPVAWNDNADDPMTVVAQRGFTSGMMSSLVPNLLPETAYAYAKNMDLTTTGRVRTRRGTEEFADSLGTHCRGLHYYSRPGTDYLMMADNTQVEYVASAGGAGTAISGWTGTGNRVQFAQLADVMFWVDGTNRLHEWGGSGSAIDVRAVVWDFTITSGGTGYADGDTITVTSPVSPAGDATFTVGVTGGVIDSVTLVSGGHSFDPADTYDTSGGDITITTSGGSGADLTAKLRAVPDDGGIHLLVAHTNRLFAVNNTYPDTLYASSFLDGREWNQTANSIRVGGDGDPITAIHPWHGFNLLVFKARSTWVVNTNPTATTAAGWTVQLVDPRVGCIAPDTVEQVGGDVMFLAADGVRSVQQILQGAQTVAIPDPISAPVDQYFDNINEGAVSGATAVAYNGRYMISFPTGSSTHNDRWMVFSTIQRAWAGVWDNYAPQAFCVTGFTNQVRLVMGDQNGVIRRWLDYQAESVEDNTSFEDDGVSYSCEVKTRGYDHGDPLSPKLGNHIEVELKDADAVIDVVAYINDGDDEYSIVSGIDLVGETLTLPFDLPSEIPSSMPFRGNYDLMSLGSFDFIQFGIQSNNRLRVVETGYDAGSTTISSNRTADNSLENYIYAIQTSATSEDGPWTTQSTVQWTSGTVALSYGPATPNWWRIIEYRPGGKVDVRGLKTTGFLETMNFN